MLNDDLANDATVSEQMNWVYGWLLNFFLLDFPINEIPVEFFEENTCGILFKTSDEIKESILEHQQLRENNFQDMVKECFRDGESRKFTSMKTADADYLLEINLIQSKDVKAEDYYNEK